MEEHQEFTVRLKRSLLSAYATGAQQAAAETARQARIFATDGYDAETVSWWQTAAARQSASARYWLDLLSES